MPEETKPNRTDIRARIAAHCFVLRIQQANGLDHDAKREHAANAAVKDADALLKALGI